MPRLERRWAVVALCFFCMLSIYVERVGFSIAYTAIAATQGVDETAKGVILGAFFNGYAVSQVPGGWAAHRYGGKLVLGGAFLTWPLLSLATPLVVGRPGAMACLRAAMGVAQGFVVPAVHTVIAQWIPPQERATATSLATSGMYLGSASAMLGLPALAAAASPSAVPVLVGGCGLLWAAAWAAFGADGPGADSLPLAGGGQAKDARRRAPPSAPWAAMLASPAVLAIVANNFTFHYALYVLMNWMPTYFAELLATDLAALGPAKAAPYLAIFAFSIAGGLAGDALMRAGRLRLCPAAARKLVNTAGFVVAAAALLALPGAKSAPAALAAVALCLAALGFARGGFSVNHMDIAPRYAGALMGLSNTAGTMAGVIGLPVTGYLLQAAGGAAQPAGWHAACAVCSGLCAAGAVVFVIFGRGDRVFA